MVQNILPIQNLDIQEIKNNFIDFLKNQEVYKDYNFDSSNLSILLDILSYNTFYNSYYLNMVANEAFMDSALLRESVVSLAKHLGYSPTGVNTLTAIVDIEIDSEIQANYITLPKSAVFTTYINNKKINFYPDKDYICRRNVYGKYYANNVKLLEGIRLNQQITITENNKNQRIILPNKNIDISSILVSCYPSIGNRNKIIFTRANNLLSLDKNSTVYFLEETTDEQYQIYFGDDIIGKGLEVGNIVDIEYIVSSGNIAEGADTFQLTTKIVDKLKKVDITVVKSASGYKDIESIDRIKLLAPLTYESQYRAVTKTDYETILKKNLPNAQYIKVWGGEENDPPYYGKVFGCVKPMGSLYLSTENKKELIRDYIQPSALIGTEIELVDADYINLVIDSNISYKINKTSLSSVEVQQLVYDAILEYASKELNGFESNFKYSKFISYIDNINTAIDNNLTDIKLRYRVYPVLQSLTDIKFELNNELTHVNGYAIYSTNFIYNGMTCFIRDNGEGKLNLYSYINNIESLIKMNVGTIIYSTGKIIIENILIDSIEDVQYIDFYALPKVYNINAIKNQLLIINENDITININTIE